MPGPEGTRVLIRGVSYRSMREAARALGVTRTVIAKCRQRGTLDKAGLRQNRLVPGPDHIACKAVTIQGVEYPSIEIASEVLGVHRSTIHRNMARGTLDYLGRGPGRPKNL
jgi:hypothetical protein